MRIAMLGTGRRARRWRWQVAELLRSLGWSDIVDLGNITTARGTEMYLPRWARKYALGSPMFNIKVVR